MTEAVKKAELLGSLGYDIVKNKVASTRKLLQVPVRAGGGGWGSSLRPNLLDQDHSHTVSPLRWGHWGS